MGRHGDKPPLCIHTKASHWLASMYTIEKTCIDQKGWEYGNTNIAEIEDRRSEKLTSYRDLQSEEEAITVLVYSGKY